MYVYGIHPVEELFDLAAADVRALYCSDPDDDKYAFVRSFSDEHDLPIDRRSDSSLSGMAGGGNHQGIVVEVDPFEYTHIDDLMSRTESNSEACLVMLDQVQDPQNLGAVLRSSAAFGADGLIIPKDRAAGVTGAVIRASAGQAYRVPVARVTNLTRTLKLLADNGWWSVAMSKRADRALDKIDLDMKSVLVFGSEHSGIRRLVRETADWRATLPMAAGVESLNIASAASCGLYEMSRQCELGR